jgi:hypothetical protein
MFASCLAMAGVDPRTIQELGGWAALEMIERYTHLSPTHKAEDVERIASHSPTVSHDTREVAYHGAAQVSGVRARPGWPPAQLAL